MTDTTQQVKWERSNNHCIRAVYRGYVLYVEAYDDGSFGWEIEQLDAPPPIDDRDTEMNIEDAQRVAISAVDVKYNTPARVPCPACEGKRVIEREFVFLDKASDESSELCHTFENYTFECPVCRGRRTIPHVLAALWALDGDVK